MQQGPIFQPQRHGGAGGGARSGRGAGEQRDGANRDEAGRLVCPFNDVLVSKNAFIWYVRRRQNWVK